MIILLGGAVFVRQMAPTLYIGDSGELMTAAATLGIPHPTGFPLFALNGNIFSRLPLGNMAWRLNLGNVALGALTGGFLYWGLLRLGINEANAGLLTLLGGSGYVFMEIMSGTEVYTLQLFLLAAIWLLLTETTSRRGLWLAGLLAGVGLGAHVTLIFMPPVILLAAFFQRRLSFKWLLRGAFCWLLGLGIFLYLPLRATQSPTFNWGNPVHWQNFRAHVTNQKDAGVLWHGSPRTIWANSKNFSQYLAAALTPGGIFLLLLGIYLTARRHLPWLVLILVFSLPFFLLLLPLPRLPRAHLYAPVFLVAIYLMAAVFNQRLSSGLKYLPALVLVSLISLNAWRFYPLTRERDNYLVYDFASNLLAASAPNSYLVGSGDLCLYNVLYLQTVENRRPDVKFLTKIPNLYQIYPLPHNYDTPTLKGVLSQKPLQFTWHTTYQPLPDLALSSNGLLYGWEVPPLNFTPYRYRGFTAAVAVKDFWYQYLLMNSLQAQGAYYQQAGKFPQGIAKLEAALNIGESTEITLQLTECYRQNGELNKAKALLGRLLARKPRYLPAVKLNERLDAELKKTN